MNTLEKWHEVFETKDMSKLDALLAEDAVMISPVVHTFQRGKEITKKYLTAAGVVLGNENFRYINEFQADTGAVLEFETEIDGVYVNGVDLISWNEAGEITEFKVMIRPLQAVNAVHAKMGELLALAQKK